MAEKTPLLAEAPLMRSSRTDVQRSPKCRAIRLLTVAAAVGLVYYGMPQASDYVKVDKTELCLTSACVHAASEILYNLSPQYKELDPCDDFEELVCGGWRDRHDLRADQGHAFTGTIMAENGELLLRHILEAPYPKDSEHSYFSPMRLMAVEKSTDEENFYKMKAAYDACLDEEKIKEAGAAPLLKVLEEIKEAYPVDAFDRSASHDLKDTILLLAKYGVSVLVSSDTGADDTDPDTVVISVSPPWTFGLPSKERYEDSKLFEKYRDVTIDVMTALYPHEDFTIFGDIADLEKRLADASPSTEEREDVTKYYNPMLIDEAAAIAPEIGLDKLLQGLAPSHTKIEKVIVQAPHYLSELSVILAATDRKVFQSYFIWRVVQTFSPYIEADAVKPYKRFKNELAGKDPESAPERWRTCVSHVDNGLGWILSRFFVEKAFSADARIFGDTIINDIRTEFIKKLESADWMDKNTTEKAVEKVHNIIQKVGYPTKSPNIMDPSSLKDYYKSLNVSADSFFGNAVVMSRFGVDFEWSAYGRPVDRNQWGLFAQTVNAYYNPVGAEIVFPAGIMQVPVFDVAVPAYMSYGAFGSVAGHELSHAFDSTGRHYDETGNYTDWWSNATVAAFTNKTSCFINQYANFSTPGPDDKPLHVNGRLTLGENIADAGGLSASFQAWKRRASEKPNKNLPGLDYFSQDQMFFVSYANWWCGKTRKNTAIERIYVDPHAPEWARILGTMANSREFRKSFKCKVKEPTCQLW